MAVSQNGWPIVPDTVEGRQRLTNLNLSNNMPHPVRVLSGDVAIIAQWHVNQYRARVEPIKPAGCWGWNVRKIGNGPDWSNHSSATAWDINAPDNPDGATPEEVMTSAQIAECHKLEKESNNVLRWGGDWSDPDPMHWEIVKDATAVHEFALTLLPKKEHKMERLDDLGLPVLTMGMSDSDYDGWDNIERVQRLVGVKPDGDYGPKTRDALKAWGLGDGTKIELDEWKRLYGLTWIGNK